MTEQQVEMEGQSEPNESPGQSLRQAREAAGMTQQALADKIFLKIKVIQQLEADEVNPKTSTTFTKGYIRLYAKHVGIDPEPLLIEFERRFNVDKSSQKLQSFSRRVSTEANDHRWMMVTYVILAIVVALVVIWWYQQPSSTEVSLNNEPLTTASVTEPAKDSVPDQTETIDEPVTTEAQTQPSDAIQTSSVVSEVLEDFDAAIESAEPPVQEGDGNVELVFTFADDCWINIVDASGEAIAYGVKSQGRVMSVAGIPPFAVTLGAPQVVSITYAGEGVDISAFPPGQIARFELPMQE